MLATFSIHPSCVTMGSCSGNRGPRHLHENEWLPHHRETRRPYTGPTDPSVFAFVSEEVDTRKTTYLLLHLSPDPRYHPTELFLHQRLKQQGRGKKEGGKLADSICKTEKQQGGDRAAWER